VAAEQARASTAAGFGTVSTAYAARWRRYLDRLDPVPDSARRWAR